MAPHFATLYFDRAVDWDILVRLAVRDTDVSVTPVVRVSDPEAITRRYGLDFFPSHYVVILEERLHVEPRLSHARNRLRLGRVEDALQGTDYLLVLGYRGDRIAPMQRSSV